MLAALLRTPKPIAEQPLELTEMPVPAPGEREVRLRVSACALCHTDLHIAEGDIPFRAESAAQPWRIFEGPSWCRRRDATLNLLNDFEPRNTFKLFNSFKL
jgi:hypothetical protein